MDGYSSEPGSAHQYRYSSEPRGQHDAVLLFMSFSSILLILAVPHNSLHFYTKNATQPWTFSDSVPYIAKT